MQALHNGSCKNVTHLVTAVVDVTALLRSSRVLAVVRAAAVMLAATGCCLLTLSSVLLLPESSNAAVLSTCIV
jgi:hypothetical protein